ncbi:MAG: hypothetical protein R2788_18885 [Saprospiraceae bacterium]
MDKSAKTRWKSSFFKEISPFNLHTADPHFANSFVNKCHIVRDFFWELADRGPKSAPHPSPPQGRGITLS